MSDNGEREEENDPCPEDDQSSPDSAEPDEEVRKCSCFKFLPSSVL